MGHLTVKIKYKKATNESTINVAQGNLTDEEYKRAITAINDYLVACVTELSAKQKSSIEDVAVRFKLPEVLPPAYDFPTVFADPHDVTNDLFEIFAKPRMSDIGFSVSTQHEMQLISDEPGTRGKRGLLRSPTHGHTMLSPHTFDAEELDLDPDYEITKSRFTITIRQGGKAVLIEFPKLLPPAKPFSEARGQMLLKKIYEHLEKYTPVMCDLDQIEDLQTHVRECKSGKVTLSEPILPVDFKRVITNLTQIVDAEDKKIDERNKAKANVGAGTYGTKPERKKATAGRHGELIAPPMVDTVPMGIEVQQEDQQPKRKWSCFPCW